MPPSLFAAFRLGLRALARERWLVSVGLLVALVRRAALWPAWLVAGVVTARAALLSLQQHPLDPAAPAEAVRALVGAPRFVALIAGLWLAGSLLAAALRVAYLAGTFPTLGTAMAGARGPRFAVGFAYGFPRVLATAGLGLVLEASGGLFGGTLILAVVAIGVRVAGGIGASPLLAAASALALTLALAVPLALSAVADASVARAALCADRPAAAFSASGGRFLARPGTFLLATLAFGFTGAFAPAVLGAAGGAVTGFADGGSPIVLLGPHLMLAVLGLLVAAAIDLAWLGTVAALACAEER